MTSTPAVRARRERLIAAAVLAVVAALIVPLPPASAQPQVPITVCVDGAPACDHSSLSAALHSAVPGDIIEVRSDLPNTNVVIDFDVEVVGAPGLRPALEGKRHRGPVITVNSDDDDPRTTVAISDLVVTDGYHNGRGGGMLVDDAVVELNRVAIEGNRAKYDGGGMYIRHDADVTIIDSTVGGNIVTRSGRDGGGIAVYKADVTITGSTISGNSARGGGGGVSSKSSHVDVVNSTISDNESKGWEGGGGFYVERGTVGLDFVTIFDNTSKKSAAGLRNHKGRVDIHATILAGNQSSSRKDCKGRLHSGGFNIIGSTSLGCSGTSNTDLVPSPGGSIDPILGPIGDNGGPTATHTPLDGSPAIDVVPSSGDECLATDQRGVDRPQPIDGACDAGATDGRCFAA